jgi:hypothetical protein
LGRGWHDDDRHGRHHHAHDDGDSFLGSLVGEIIVGMLTSPSYRGTEYRVDGSSPRLADADLDYYFPRFPYDRGPGYLTCTPPSMEFRHTPDGCSAAGLPRDCEAALLSFDRRPPRSRTWAGRLQAEYGTDFDDLTRIAGRFLLSTKSRWGLDTQMDYLEENLPLGAHDHLWIGDCNVIRRFTETEHALTRWGLGFNWLDDPLDTDFGFNFTAGMDLFPGKPWVVSGTIDWGTLGSAELFRFNTTVGVLIRRIEAFTGYEYLDLDRTQINTLLGGVRIWF